jgi:predicted RecA/RadA family phage recombinase
MAQNHIQLGRVMSWTNTTGTSVASGSPVAVGNRIGVALEDIADNAGGDVATDEVFELPKEVPLAIGQGDAVYLGAGKINATDTDIPAGYAFSAAASDATTIQVKING